MAVTGVVRDDPRSPGGFELSRHRPRAPRRERRLSRSPPKSMGPRSSSSIDTSGSGAAGRWRSRGCGTRSCRRSATSSTSEGFTLVDTPILTGAIGEEAGDLFATDYFDLGKAYLAQTGQLYVEAAAAALGKVYCFGPTFRAEKSKTRRHLTEFWMVEPEVAFNDSDDNMRLQEDVRQLHRGTRARAAQGGAEGAGARHRAARAGACRRFPRISYTDAVDAAQRARLRHASGATTSAATTRPCSPRSTTGRSSSSTIPRQVKAFYMKENPDDPRTVLNNDCLAPEGYGEIIGGSQREDDYDRLLARIHRAGARSRGVPLVPRSPEVRHLRALGLRARRRADGRVDLRASRTSARRSRFRGRFIGCIRRAGGQAVGRAGGQVREAVIPSGEGPCWWVARANPGEVARSARDDGLLSLTACPSEHLTARLHLIPQPIQHLQPRSVRSRCPRASASCSTASNRSRNFRLARSSAGPGCTPALRARLTTANSRSPISSTRASLGAGAGVFGSAGAVGVAEVAGRRESVAAGVRPLPPPAPRAPSRLAPRRPASRSRPTPRAPAVGRP